MQKDPLTFGSKIFHPLGADHRWSTRRPIPTILPISVVVGVNVAARDGRISVQSPDQTVLDRIKKQGAES